MTTARWLLFTDTERDAVLALNRAGEAQVRPHLIDNPQADDTGSGLLTGRHAAPASLLEDEESHRFHEVLGPLMVVEMESERLFLPPQE